MVIPFLLLLLTSPISPTLSLRPILADGLKIDNEAEGRSRLEGLAVWHNCPSESCPGTTMRNGERWRCDGATLAVDKSEWQGWGGKEVMISSGDITATLLVADTGYLYAAGWFAPRNGRWRRVKPGEPGALRIVADMPRCTHERLWKGLTTVVSVIGTGSPLRGAK